VNNTMGMLPMSPLIQKAVAGQLPATPWKDSWPNQTWITLSCIFDWRPSTHAIYHLKNLFPTSWWWWWRRQNSIMVSTYRFRSNFRNTSKIISNKI
jgi:hypothetical protein